MQDDKNAVYQMRFPQKLWHLLNFRTEAILWGGTGRTILLNYRVLHNYLQCDNSIFKTTNISSFVRQLNLYGFRKVTSHLQDPLCNSSNPYMHEYIHDYFQFGRPELLNKITRKALTVKRNLKPKTLLYTSPEQILFLSPLQKARRALRIALKNAAHEFYVQHSSKPDEFQLEDLPDEFCDDEDNIDLEWAFTRTRNETEFPKELANNSASDSGLAGGDSSSGVPSQENVMEFSEETCRPKDYSPTQFLNMPELDTTEDKGIELLAEFNISDDIDEGITRTLCKNKDIACNSLNCVLPSISNDHIDDVSMIEKTDEDTNHYHAEWEQMFHDIMTNKQSRLSS